jgi:hypothetical protein
MAEDLSMSVEPEELCGKIRDIYPEVGRCGIDVAVGWNQDQQAWEVALTQRDNTLKTFLEPEDVQACLENERCVNLGVQIGKLEENVKKLDPEWKARHES